MVSQKAKVKLVPMNDQIWELQTIVRDRLVLEINSGGVKHFSSTNNMQSKTQIRFSYVQRAFRMMVLPFFSAKRRPMTSFFTPIAW